MAYALATSYAGEALLSGFNWFDGADPNHGFVRYQSRTDAGTRGLYSVDQTTGVVRLGVDSTHVYPLDGGRPSIRLESKEAYTHGLFIADFLHMPPSQCGLWPAFWSYGHNWPYDGEIDIIEGVNDQYNNLVTAHTSMGCTISDTLKSKASGTSHASTCDVGSMNVGCGYDAPANDTTSYGDAFNAAGGGVYAMEWDAEYIKIWHFSRNQIPGDISAKKPMPEEWGLPHAIFGGKSCDVDTHFKNMNLVININFCGDWPNGIWGKTDGCGKYAPTCNEFVAKNPQAFTNTYWDVHHIDAYQKKAKYGAKAVMSPTKTNSSSSAINDGNTTTTSKYDAKFASPAAVAPKGIASPKNLTGAMSGTKDPLQVDGATLLGCFGSSNRFQSFRKVADSRDMTVARCVELCNGAMYAGAYDTQCFCAETLDANTRAVDEEVGACNHPCPGNAAQSCGGLARKVAAPANFTEVAAAAAAGLSDKMASEFVKANGGAAAAAAAAALLAVNTTAPVINVNVTDPGRNETRKRAFHWRRKSLLVRREDGPRNMLLTVYGTLKKETTQPVPPPMAPGSTPASMKAHKQKHEEKHEEKQVTHLVVPVVQSAKFVEQCECETNDAAPPPPSSPSGAETPETMHASAPPTEPFGQEPDLPAPRPPPVQNKLEATQPASPPPQDAHMPVPPPAPQPQTPHNNASAPSGQERQIPHPMPPNQVPDLPAAMAGADRTRTTVAWGVLVVLLSWIV
ncbi:hypothetical protein E4U54_007882 [Claviceps lovelessii]|nr:hypothetical protein E4U54_007882 [Claviceps lovelessii]